MGITIHYRGFLKDKSKIQECLQSIKRYAHEQGWEFEEFVEENVTLSRSYEDEDGEHSWEYKGPLHVLVILPHDHCEPLYFEFGEDLFFKNYVKTQFAPPEIHAAIIHLLKSLESFLKALHVEDEAGYWESQDLSLLESNLENCWDMIQQRLEENPSLKGPVRTEGGRILDLVGTGR